MKYPTVADAKRAGMIPAAGWLPVSAAFPVDRDHASGVNADGSVNAAHPGSTSTRRE